MWLGCGVLLLLPLHVVEARIESSVLFTVSPFDIKNYDDDG